MSTPSPSTAPSGKRSGLPRPFVALCVLLGALVGAYAVVTLLSIATASTEHRTRTFRAAEELRVDAGAGDVTIVGEPRHDIRVEMAIQRGMWRGAWQPDVDLRAGGRKLRLASECSVWAHIGVGDCGAAFTLRVPRGMPIVVTGGSADVTLSRLTGTVAVDVGSGDVDADELTGPLKLKASSGDVTVDGYRGSDAFVQVSSGDVDVSTVRAPRRLHAEASSGDVDVAVPDVGYRVLAEVDSGDRDVQVRQDPGARRLIEAKASSGDVTVAPLGDGR